MDANSTNNRRIAAALVALVVSVTLLVGGGIALAGASDASFDTTDQPAETNTAGLDQVEVSAPVDVKAAAPAPEPAAAKAPAPVETDCDAFFAELDAEHNADNERFAEVLDTFDIPNELIVEEVYAYVEVDYQDPIVEAISNSFWQEVADDEDPDLYEHSCFHDMPFEGCEGVEEGYEMGEEELAEGDFADHDSEMDDHYAELDAQWEAEWEQMIAERNGMLEALAAALAGAGVEHEVVTDYDWVSVTFDLDDERAVPVIAAVSS